MFSTAQGKFRRNSKCSASSKAGFPAALAPAFCNLFTVTRLYTFDGLKQIEVEELPAGDIGLIAATSKGKLLYRHEAMKK